MKTLRTTRQLFVAAAIATVVTFGVAGTASAAPLVISAGHVDVVDVDYASGALTVQLLDSAGVERDPATVELQVLPGARTTVPANSAYSFLGAPGDPVWILPQTQNPNLLWAGWNSADVPSGTFASGLQLSLIGVTGGELAIYTSGLSGPSVLFDNGNGLPDTRPLAIGAHTHANWAFSGAGTYTVTFRVSGTLSTGATVSDEATYTFTVQA
ncbi:choice-of-anchor M domain-containing protein [Amycolatopsis lurida]